MPKTEKSTLIDLTDRTNRIAVAVQQDWGTFSDATKELFAADAYDWIGENDGFFRRLLRNVAAQLTLLWFTACGQKKEYLALIEALDNLADNVLDQIEKESPEYQKEVERVLLELMGEIKNYAQD